MGTVFQKDVLHRSHKLVGHTRAVVAKHAKPLHEIFLAGELAKHFCEKHSLRRRQFTLREFDQFTLQRFIFRGALGQKACQEVAVPMVGNEFSAEQFCVRIDKRQQYLARPCTFKGSNRFDPRFSYCVHAFSVRACDLHQ